MNDCTGLPFIYCSEYPRTVPLRSLKNSIFPSESVMRTRSCMISSTLKYSCLICSISPFEKNLLKAIPANAASIDMKAFCFSEKRLGLKSSRKIIPLTSSLKRIGQASTERIFSLISVELFLVKSDFWVSFTSMSSLFSRRNAVSPPGMIPHEILSVNCLLSPRVDATVTLSFSRMTMLPAGASTEERASSRTRSRNACSEIPFSSSAIRARKVF